MAQAEAVGEPARQGGLDSGRGAIPGGLHDARLDRVMRRLVACMGGVEDAERLQPVRMVHGEAPGNHATEREAEDGGLGDAEMIEQFNELFREDGERRRGRRHAAVAMAVQVEGDDAMGAGQCRNLPLP